MTTNITKMAAGAKKASHKIAGMPTDKKNSALRKIAENMLANRSKIEAANKLDVEKAEHMVKEGTMSNSLFKRLIFTESKLNQLSTYLEEVAKLPDPVGVHQYGMRLAKDLDLYRKSSPIGVIAIIFESRPEVVVQASALCLKSGNAVILKGGSEASSSNKVLFEIINESLEAIGMGGSVNFIETREDVAELLDQDKYIDLVIPRGSNEFVRYIQENTKIPVLGHSSGICHVYIDKETDRKMAIEVVVDAKTNYPAACNAVETVLIHQEIAPEIMPDLIQQLTENGVQTVGCPASQKIASDNALTLGDLPESGWTTEYSDMILAIKIIEDTSKAIEHINEYGSHHTDSIITQNSKTAERFIEEVDSGCVFHNVSTRFSDGYVFGLGAEVGISTNKTHARGPVGLEGLVIYKYILKGKGQIMASFSGEHCEHFLHEPIENPNTEG